MSLLSRTNNVIDIFEQFRHSLKAQGDYGHEKELADMIQMLDSPLFKQIVTVQDSVQELGEKIHNTDQVEIDDFDITATGDLSWFREGPEYGDDNDGGWAPDNSDKLIIDDGLRDSIYAADQEFLNGMMSASQGREIITIQLRKPPVGGLGFSVIGLQSETRGELGIFVQALQPGGIAEIDGRLSESDQILAINGQRVDAVMSHQEAITLLQQTTGIVELIIARGGIPNAKSQVSHQNSGNSSTLSDTSLNQDDELSHWRQEETIILVNDGSGLGFGIAGGKTAGVIVRSIVPNGVADRDGRLKHGDHILQINEENLFGMSNDLVAGIIRRAGNEVKIVISRDMVGPEPNEERPEQLSVDTFEVQLQKNARGLGITIYGYVGDGRSRNEKGIFIQRIAEGSAAAQDGRLRPDDQIIEVDGHSLNGMNNNEAINMLRNTGNIVTLVVARVFERSNLSMPRQKGLSQEDLIKAVANDELYDYPLRPDEEEIIKQEYVKLLGGQALVQVAQFSKFFDGGSLGISVEGSTERQDGVYVSHRIHSVSTDGPVGQTGKVVPGDFLIEVNGINVLEMTHPEVVKLIQTLPRNIRLIVARFPEPDVVDAAPVPAPVPIQPEVVPPQPTHEQQLSHTSITSQVGDVLFVQLEKRDRGLGFSILDSQDPQNEKRSIIVIKSIVAGGPAEETGALHSGDELVSVNGVTFDNVSLDMAVQALKATPKGTVRIGVRKNRIPDDSPAQKQPEPTKPKEDEKVEEFRVIGVPPPVLPGSNNSFSEDTRVKNSDGSCTIKIRKDVVGLGITLGEDKDGYGFPVKGIIESGTIKREGSIQINDRIVKIGTDVLKSFTIQQTRAILRKAAMTDEVAITYFPAAVIEKKIKEDAALRPSPPQPEATPVQTNALPPVAAITQEQPVTSFTQPEPRIVDIIRHPEFGLGISIVGGRQDDNDQKLQGIFIKHVLESSPAGQNGLLKTGDQILEVGGVDISTASHEQAVAAIRYAKSPVRFVVKGFVRQPQDNLSNSSATAIFKQDGTDGVTTEEQFRISEKYKDYAGEVSLVALQKGNGGIGLSIADGDGDHIYVVDVKSGGVADVDGRIRSGDEILEVNDVQVQGLSHSDASAILRKAEGTAKLVVGRPHDTSGFKSLRLPAAGNTGTRRMKTIQQEQTITLNKGHAGLGFAIGEGRSAQNGENGIFIRNVTEGGTAYKDGRLRIGDQLLSINNHSLHGLQQADAVSIIRGSEGQVVLQVAREIEVPVGADEDLPPSVDENINVGEPVVPNQELRIQNQPPPQITLPIEQQHQIAPPPFDSTQAETQQIISPTLSPIRVLDPVDELEEATTKNPIIMENPTSIQIVKANVGLGISIVGGNDTPLVSFSLFKFSVKSLLI
uniref:Multiple PDZ domain protein n=1 Tax=Clytia hemisphaerica TaxID=252671 RepID=A0A7M5XCZ7_9CNID